MLGCPGTKSLPDWQNFFSKKGKILSLDFIDFIDFIFFLLFRIKGQDGTGYQDSGPVRPVFELVSLFTGL